MATSTPKPTTLPPSGPDTPYERAGERQVADGAQYPRLILSHFSPPPFVTFGTVKVGFSKSALLVLENPHAEVAEVLVDKFPSSKGFSLERRKLLLEPKERCFLSITWTPLQDCRVRELIIFVVNGIVKHQAVLLGRAEQTKTKKNLWNVIKKKHDLAGMTSTRSRKRELNVKSMKTACVSENMGNCGLSRIRSPLQSCENAITAGENLCPPKDFIDNAEKKRFSSYIGPQGYHGATHTPDSSKKSKTYSVLCMPECESLQKLSISSLQKDFNHDEVGKIASIQKLDDKFLLPITSVIKEDHVASTSDSMSWLTTNPVFCTTTYCKSVQQVTCTKNQQSLNFEAEVTCIQNSANGLESVNCSSEGSDGRTLSHIHSPTDTSDSQPVLSTSLIQRRILSPDSFVNNSYSPDDDSDLAHTPRALSPDQFVRDNYLVAQSEPQQLHGSLFTSSLTSHPDSCISTNSSPVQNQNKTHNSSEKLEPVKSRLTYCVKPKQKCTFPHSEITNSLNNERTKRLPLLSATITKSKSATEERSEISKKPKCRRDLGSALTEPESIGPQHSKLVIAFNDLPIIGSISDGSEVQEGEILRSTSIKLTTLSRKRKSGECKEETASDIKINNYMEFADISKTIVDPCVETEKLNNTKRLSSSRYLSKKEKQMDRKKYGSFRPLSTFASLKRNKRLVTVPQSRLTFVKSKTAIPRHPMPFAAKNVFFDERWKEKQEKGFIWWLNFILTPDDFIVKVDSVQVNAATLVFGEESHHKTSVPKAPTKEEMSLRAYTARCKLNRLRRTACRLFTSESMVKAIKRLEIEIESKRLLVREDRHLWKDIGERQKVLNWLLFYNPLWLRIGLETIYGELISLESNSDVMGLARFILNRVLWNPDLAAEYSHPTVPHLYRDGHGVALSKFTLKKILLLVFFLDHAKQSKLIDHDPCLFCKDAVFKTSKEILLAFSRDFLSGEGDLSRHLGFLGLPVSHIQTPLDEFNFAVTNLAVDLQCGVRLVRIMELLMQNWSLSKKLRVPAVSRLQKIHNVELVLQVLKERGIQLKDECGTTIDSKDIVDRHREKTLALLWKIVFMFQVNISLNMEQLKEEIDFLKHSWNIKKKAIPLHSSSNSLSKVNKESDSSSVPETYSENVRLLMEWVKAVCLFYSAKVENFTVSFSDGRLLCYLIHHYHPSYVPLDSICQHTTLTVECTQTGTIVLNSSSESDNSLDTSPGLFDHGITTPVLYKELLENERKNFQLVNAAVADLGGIPAMIHHSDMSNTIPDEKVVITYLSFLCARLLDLHKETRAACIIQRAWKKYRLKMELEHHQAWWQRDLSRKYNTPLKWHTQARTGAKNAVSYQQLQWASVTIQKYFRSWLLVKKDWQTYKRMKSSALVIQRAFRRWKKHRAEEETKAAKVLQALFRKWQTRKLALEHKAALLIQSWYKMCKEEQQYLKVRKSVIKIQACFRCFQAKRAYEIKKQHVVTLQKYYRAYQQGKVERATYLQKHTAIISLQAAFRGMKARQHYKRMRAACVIQAFWRMRQERIRFLRLRHSAIILQSHVRKLQRLQRFMESKNVACVKVQYRASVTSNQALLAYKNSRTYSIMIQHAYRIMQSRKAVKQLQSALKIQATYRAYIARKRFLNLKATVIKIQALLKMKRVRKWYCDLSKAALYMQRQYRAKKCICQHREEYRRLKKACVQLQAAVRGHLVRKQVRLWRKSVAVIQFYYIMQRERKNCFSMYSAAHFIENNGCKEQIFERKVCLSVKRSAICLQAAVKIQAVLRGHVVKKKYLTIRQACIRIQKWYKACKISRTVRANFLRLKSAAVTIQRAFHHWVAYRQHQQHTAAISIQSAFRKYRAQKQFRCLKNALQTIQQHYKAQITGKKVRQQYLRLYNSVLKLQAAWRGNVVRKEVKKHQAAVIIQSYYRMHVSWIKFKAMRFAVIVIQKHFRAYQIRKAHSVFLKNEAAAVVLQAAFRGMKVRKERCRLNKAATTIQIAYKAFILRKRYVTLRAATVAIQQRYRLVRHTNYQRQEFLCMRNAAIKMQATYRGVKTRRHIQHMHLAATSIQSIFRMYQLHFKYKTIRTAATIIQVNYRAFCEGKKGREKYLKLKTSTIHLQAIYRGKKTHQRLKLLNDAATVIQSYYRMYRQYRYFKNLIRVTKWVQLHYRACKTTKTQVHFRIMKSSAVCIQSVFRGMKTRRHLKAMHAAASIVQRRVKTSLEQKKYLALKKASILVQKRYRLKKIAQHHQQEYICLRKAAITIQATYRGLKVRRKIRQMHRAATVIQASFRMHRVQITFRNMKLASTVVQQYYRAYRNGKCERENYLKQRISAIVVQAAYRGLKARQHLKMTHCAATKIQAVYRMHRQHFYYKRVQWATKVIQQRYRANKLRDFEMYQYCAIKKAVIFVQAAFRSMRERKHLQDMHRAASIIQRQFRTFSERRRFLALRTTTVSIQRRYRALIVVKQQRHKYLSLCKAAVHIQACYRGLKVRKEVQQMHLAATAIQTAFRVHKVNNLYKKQRTAAYIIQNYYRYYVLGKSECEKFLTLRKSVVVIQSAYRGMKDRQKLKAMHAAAKVIQCHYRMHKQRTCYRRILWAVKTIQKRYRASNTQNATMQQYMRTKTATICIQAALGAKTSQATLQFYVERKLFLKEKAATVVIQSAYQDYKVRAWYKAIQASAVVIQRWYRACRMVHFREQYLAKEQAAFIIQAAFRRRAARRLAKQKCAARKIQSFLQMTVYRQHFIKFKAATVILQSYYRMYRARRQYLIYKKSALILQKHFRCYLAMKHRREAFQQSQKRILIQAVINGLIEQQQLKDMMTSLIIIQKQAAACMIQARYRSYQQRKKFLQYKSAALVIQKHVRALHMGRCDRLKYYQTKRAIVTLQAFVRGWLVRKKRWFRTQLQHEKYHQDHQKIIKLQRRIRFWLNSRNRAPIIQGGTWGLCLQKCEGKIKSGIIKFQSLWRGYSWRKNNSTAKMRVIQQRLEQANRDSHEENKLCNRTANAIDYLLKYKHLSYILAALKHLEVATRLSSVCCENMAQSGAILTIFILIRSCNRSIPCMEVIRYAIQVLLNLSKYDKTTKAVYSVEKSVDTLLELMHIYRGKAGDKVEHKGGSIFTKTCCLLAILAQDSKTALEIRDIPKAVDRILNIYKHTARKHEMDTKRICSAQTMSVFVNGNFFGQTPPIQTQIVSRIKPDWVLKKNNMREIVDPLNAIQMVLDTLNVAY